MAAQDDLTLNVIGNHRRKWDELLRLLDVGPVEVAWSPQTPAGPGRPPRPVVG